MATMISSEICKNKLKFNQYTKQENFICIKIESFSKYEGFGMAKNWGTP